MSGSADWLAKAEADLSSMNWAMQSPAINFDDVIFHAQQCIEENSWRSSGVALGVAARQYALRVGREDRLSRHRMPA